MQILRIKIPFARLLNNFKVVSYLDGTNTRKVT